MKRVAFLVLAAAAVLGLLLLGGCGGDGGNGGGGPTGLGAVTGVVTAGLDDPVPLGNVHILLRTQTDPAVTVAEGVSDGNGDFTIGDVPPGTYDVVIVVDPETGFVVPPWAEAIVVTVVADGPPTVIPEDSIHIVGFDELPPEPA